MNEQQSAGFRVDRSVARVMGQQRAGQVNCSMSQDRELVAE